jgi:hypothetical protein
MGKNPEDPGTSMFPKAGNGCIRHTLCEPARKSECIRLTRTMSQMWAPAEPHDGYLQRNVTNFEPS